MNIKSVSQIAEKFAHSPLIDVMRHSDKISQATSLAGQINSIDKGAMVAFETNEKVLGNHIAPISSNPYSALGKFRGTPTYKMRTILSLAR